MNSTLDQINVNALLNEDKAAIVKINDQWLYVVDFVPNTKYYYSVHATNGYTTVVESLQRDHPVIIITPEDRATYNLPVED